jgi:hypothetical protein
MDCEPTAWPAVVKLAMVTPWLVLSVPVPRVLEPSSKVIEPVGVPAPEVEGATVAVAVTAWPETVGLAEEGIAVVVMFSSLA